MINLVVTSIGWKSLDDRETEIKKEDILQSIPALHQMKSQLAETYKGDVKRYIEKHGIETPHDVMVLLRRMLRREGRYVTYKRGSLKGLKSKNNSPVYLYKLI